MIIFYLLFLPAVALGQCISENDKTDVDDPNAKVNLYEGQQKFSFDVLSILNGFEKEKNIFFSPHSIYQALLLAYITSANETEDVIRKSLHIPESQSKVSTVQNYNLEKYFQSMRSVNSSADYEFRSVNKLFLAQQVEVRECMKNILKDEIENVDFKNPEITVNHINHWVENITNNHIKDFLPKDAIHEDSKALLANAAYFKGLWESKFLPENTKNNSVFYVSTKNMKMVDLMTQKGMFNYMISEKLKAHILELPYKSRGISMIIVLPRYEDQAVDRLIKQLADDDFQDILEFDDFFPRQVEVEIPKFVVEQSLDLKPVFQKLGLEDLFDEDADFSTLTGQKNDIKFSDAIHKSKVEVNEDGTVAAAATAVFLFRSSRPAEPTKFVANHPFVYFIFDKMSRNILFLGVYRVPDKKYRNGKRIAV